MPARCKRHATLQRNMFMLRRSMKATQVAADEAAVVDEAREAEDDEEAVVEEEAG